MLSLHELLTSNVTNTNEYYEALKDNLVDLLNNVHIDITTSNKPLIRWAIMSDEYANFNTVISTMVSNMIAKIRIMND